MYLQIGSRQESQASLWCLSVKCLCVMRPFLSSCQYPTLSPSLIFSSPPLHPPAMGVSEDINRMQLQGFPGWYMTQTWPIKRTHQVDEDRDKRVLRVFKEESMPGPLKESTEHEDCVFSEQKRMWI